MLHKVVLTVVVALALRALSFAATHVERPLPRLEASINIDGSLDEGVWERALRVPDFVEIYPGDGTPPVVQTVAHLLYDADSLYVGIECSDPQPEQIRASFSDRDSVVSDQDFVQFDLDTKNDEKSSYIFRVNPRGIQADALFSEATGVDDFSPDYSFESQGRINEDGWVVELRIPLSTLRYSDAPVQTWGITFYRNFPRQYRRQMTSPPVPRGSNCWLCHNLKLTGIEGLPSSRYVLAVPYATVQRDSQPVRAADDETSMDGGLDLKWIPVNSLTLDGTYNPDFAQIESDVPQIAVNTRFALFYPEKRNFFLEGKDLLDTPVTVAYTRTITSPAWGARGTGLETGAAYTLLITRDEGGGSRIIPGPLYSSFVPQGEATVAIGRLRYAMGNSFAGLIFTDREGDGSFNRVAGPDLQWRPTDANQLKAQLLVSSSEYRAETAGATDLTDYAGILSWLHSTSANTLQVDYQRFGREFRADSGFVPQVGVERMGAVYSHSFYPGGWLRVVEPGFTGDYYQELGGEPVSRSTFPSLLLRGRWNTAFTFEYHIDEQVRPETKLLNHSYFAYNLKANPSRVLSAIGVSGKIGQLPDYANERVGQGGVLSVTATLRPGIHLNTVLVAERQWLNIRSARLFTADVAQVKATFNFTPRFSLRAIAQYEKVRRDPSLYNAAVRGNEGDFGGSLLFSYRLNWQTALYAGFSREQILIDGSGYHQGPNHFFLKLAYAFEH